VQAVLVDSTDDLWHLLALLNADKDVIGGLYPMKSLPVKWCVNGIPGADENDPSGLVEVTKTGTGFLLMKRHVFEKLNAHPAVRPFTNDIGLDPALNVHMKTYFDTAVREGRYYSEDWTFCENWRDLGGQVFVDKRVLLRHVGTYVFDGTTQEKLYQDLGALINSNQSPVDRPAAAAAVPAPEVLDSSDPEPAAEAPAPAAEAPAPAPAVDAEAAPAEQVLTGAELAKKAVAYFSGDDAIRTEMRARLVQFRNNDLGWNQPISKLEDPAMCYQFNEKLEDLKAELDQREAGEI